MLGDFRSKVFPSAEEALFDVDDGSSIMVGGFVTAGTPTDLILALVARQTRDLTCIANNIGLGDRLDDLCEGRQLRKVVASFAIRASSARSSRFEAQYLRGEVELELVPQGTLAERIRAGGAGIGAFYTPTGVGTHVSEGKEVRTLGGVDHLLEFPLTADFAFVKAHKADRAGNLVYRGAQRNFNQVMATAARCVIVEADELVEVGEIDPEMVGTPGLYVDRIVLGGRHAPNWGT